MSKRVFITDFFRNKSDSNKKIKVVNKVKNENLVSKAQTVVESGKEVSDPVEYDQRNEKVQETTISSTPSDRLLESGGYADFCKEHHFDKVAWINEEDGMYTDLISGREMEAKGVQIPAFGCYWLCRNKQ